MLFCILSCPHPPPSSSWETNASCQTSGEQPSLNPHTQHCTSQYTHSTLHFTVHTLNTALHRTHTQHCTSQYTHSTLHFTVHTLNTALHSPHTQHCTLHTAQCTLHTTHCTICITGSYSLWRLVLTFDFNLFAVPRIIEIS